MIDYNKDINHAHIVNEKLVYFMEEFLKNVSRYEEEKNI